MAGNATEFAEAVEEIEAEFDAVSSEPDGEGGAFVVVESIDAGDRWVPDLLAVEFQILFNYPYAAIYPYYTTPELRRADAGQLPQGLQRVEWRGRQVTQISLRSNHWEPQHDTALSKLKQVRHWLQTVPL